MKDRFRFRVWNKKEKYMIYNAETAYDGNNYTFPEYQIQPKANNDGHIHCFSEYLYSFKEYEIMQCTGLKDKNGKLIYEGDIVKVTGSRDASGYGIVEYLQAGCQFFVNGYLDYPSHYHSRRKGEFHQPLQEWLCTEVIGNIYENPELLEVNNANL